MYEIMNAKPIVAPPIVGFCATPESNSMSEGLLPDYLMTHTGVGTGNGFSLKNTQRVASSAILPSLTPLR